jgi:hypothetical protein
MTFPKRKKYKNATTERFAKLYVLMEIHANTNHRPVSSFVKDI